MNHNVSRSPAGRHRSGTRRPTGGGTRRSHARRRIGLSSIALAVVFLVGLGLLLYPTVSNWWNSRRQSQAIVEYTEQTSAMDEAHVAELLEAARQYNAGLAADEGRFTPTPADTTEYENLLDVSDTGIMGYLEIPKLDVSTPIYHGTDASVLQSGAGHLEGSSLPVGGKGTHTVLSGHRGLPSSKLFTDLDDLEQGDVFMIHVLDRTLTYQVDQIVTVDPYDMDDLAIDPDQDYCTLVTCTPYGINTQRLLVRGHRIPNRTAAQADAAPQAEATSPIRIAVIVAIVVAVAAIATVVTVRLVRHRR
ncbi:sortase [Bifidobacterium pullorum subsp. saeculare DSM 6531 = LMG 14934]|uniref:Sortase n=2 Tax=Bifidobacterium pullorum TaxID=78448 RepID=A0A087D1D5_9BIFI|nr:sortase [Bifidobacterium pullorum subsp. saeculare DSM 6531 = LMG 14934]